MRGRSQKAGPGALDRRSLFRYGAASGALVLAGPALARRTQPGSPAASPAPATKAEPFELDELTIADLQKRMVSGEETARSLTEKYIARIEVLDKRGPQLRSVLEVNPEATAIAESLDAERKAGRVRS